MKPASDIGLYFDSWDEIFKKPFGAIERNSKVDFKISFEPTISSKINSFFIYFTHEIIYDFIYIIHREIIILNKNYPHYIFYLFLVIP